MHVRLAGFWLQKRGNLPAEYEDAFAPECRVETEAWRLRTAVADGATETSFSGLWARELVTAYAKGRLEDGRLCSGLHAARRRWRHAIPNRPLPWYAAEKLRQGAYATVVGLTVMHDLQHQGGGWAAIAAGDSCLFHLRAGRLVRAFPLQNVDQFSSRPALLASLPGPASSGPALAASAAGSWRSGDSFLLATDAVAEWLLREGRRAWGELLEVLEPADFAGLMEHRRQAGTLRNDDCTVVRLDVSTRGRPQ